MLRIIFIKIIAIAIGGILLFRLLSISEGIPVSITSNPAPSIATLKKVIHHNPSHAFAYEQIALIELQNQHYDSAKQYAVKALQNNLSSGMATAILMRVYDHENNTERAHQAALLATHLWPSHDVSMQLIAKHWLQAGFVDRAMSAWNISLSQTPVDEHFSKSFTATTIFPILNKIAQHEDSTQLFQTYHMQPPSWWDPFFHYMVAQPNNLTAVDRFYQQALLNGKASPANKKLYLSNLIQGNRWTKAHDIWKNGLSEEEKKHTGAIFDGGFESGRTTDQHTDEKFSWTIGYKSDIQAYLDKFSRASGSYSLRIAFNSWITDYWGYISQVLTLKPGNYRIDYKTRANLNAEKGVRWIVHCMNTTDYTELGTGKALAGFFDWQTDQLHFTVPDDNQCKAQKLTLVLVGKTNTSEARVRGDIWFDDFFIHAEE